MSDDDFLKNIDLDKVWTKFKSQYEQQNPPDFITHSHYVEYVSVLSENISFKTKLKFKNRISTRNRNSTKKITLIKLTLENLRQEFQTIKQTPEFAQVCVSWISVKSYYLIFNLLIILRYLITCEDKSFDLNHYPLVREMIEYLDRKVLSFSQEKFNKIHNGQAIHDWKSSSSNNHLKFNYDPEILYKQILKKLQEYKEEDYKRANNISNIRKKTDREKVMKFRENSKVNLLEFFYWYRIKANYRDLEFLDKEIESSKFTKYYNDYYYLTYNMFQALKKIINELSMIRFREKIINF